MQQVLRREIKYKLTVIQYYQLADAFSKLLHQDTHNGENGYMIRSLYYDTLNDNDFFEKEYGTDPRRKIRFRCYDANAQFASLEMKQKQGVQQRKRSIKISRQDVQSCIEGDYTSLLSYNSDFAAECFGLMSRQFYRPKAIIEYTRKAYVAKENNIRITFDQNVNCSGSVKDFFSECLPLKPAFDPFTVIMEVKYDGFLLSYIKDLIENANASPIAAGKYSAGRF